MASIGGSSLGELYSKCVQLVARLVFIHPFGLDPAVGI